MADTVILTKPLRNGDTATVTISGRTVTAWRGTQKLASHYGPHHRAANPPAGYVAAIGPLMLTQDEADQVEAAWNAQPAPTKSLPAQRELLVASVQAENNALIDYRAIAWDRRDGGTDPYPLEAQHEARIAEARKSLAAFDAEHPEVVVAVRIQRDADIQQWANR